MPDGIMDPVTGKPRLLSEQCATCVGRPVNGLDLRRGRLRELIQENTGDGKTGLICHETIDYSKGEPPQHGGEQALCRWFYKKFGHLANFIRICERIGGFTEVPPPPPETERDSVSAPPESASGTEGQVDLSPRSEHI